VTRGRGAETELEEPDEKIYLFLATASARGAEHTSQWGQRAG
jgi:hypothetical protein